MSGWRWNQMVDWRRMMRFAPIRSVLTWRGALFLLAFLLIAGPSRAASHRFWLAAQHDFGKKQGFYLNFENTAEGSDPCRLPTLKLILGVADGKNWRFITATPAWQFDKHYAVKAVIARVNAELWLDGRRLEVSPGGFASFDGPLSADEVPGWANGPAEYEVHQGDLKLQTAGDKPVTVPLLQAGTLPEGLALFDRRPMPVSVKWHSRVNTSFTIETSFRLAKEPNIHDFVPIIDAFGQCRYADWPGKVKSDEDLKAAALDEEKRLKTLAPAQDEDAYGGSLAAAWKLPGSGYYQAAERNGYWWLISPDGHPCFYRGVCSAPAATWETTPVTGRESLFQWLPPRDGAFSAAWRRNAWGGEGATDYCAFQACNLIRRDGAQWQDQSGIRAERRVKAFGFVGLGKWGDLASLPNLPVLHLAGVPLLVDHPDVFDPVVQGQITISLRKSIEPRRNDPLVIGWSIGNEYEEIIKPAEIAGILKKESSVPAKRSLVDYALKSLYNGSISHFTTAWGARARTAQELYAAPLSAPKDDVEALRRFYEESYYDLLYRTVKTIDPHHLYLGCWIVPGWWENEEDWRLTAAHCDVVGYDRYAPQFTDELLSRLVKASNKPILCGEFSYPEHYHGARGYGRYDAAWAESEADAGDDYGRWTEAASTNPYCVGINWFEYRDQPLTGRGPGRGPDLIYGEHYAFGIVDISDRPKWDLVERMRKANLQTTARRLAATAAGASPDTHAAPLGP